jgi:hypothetical protein
VGMMAAMANTTDITVTMRVEPGRGTPGPWHVETDTTDPVNLWIMGPAGEVVATVPNTVAGRANAARVVEAWRLILADGKVSGAVTTAQCDPDRG